LKLRLKLTIILSLLIGALLATLYGYSYTVILSRYQIIENNEVTQELSRLENVIGVEVDRIYRTTVDWAQWDATYQYMNDKNQDYIDSNLVESTFSVNDVNLMLYYDTSGRLIQSRAYDIDEEVWCEVPAYFLGDLTKTGLLDEESSTLKSGLLNLPEGVIIFASNPILTSTGEGPSRGTLIVGRYINASEIGAISTILDLSIDAQSINADTLPADYEYALSNMETVSEFVYPVNDSTVAGYTMFTDYTGEPCLILRIDLSRNIYQEGQKVLLNLMMAFTGIGLFIGIVSVVANDWLIVKPITDLSRRVSEIGRKGDFNERIEVKGGDDERASLINDINGMLDSLSKARENENRQRNEVEAMRREHFRELMNGASRIINSVRFDLRSPLQVIKNATYLLRENPDRADALTDMIDESVESAIATIEDVSSKTQTGELKITVTDLRYVIETAIELAKIPENIKVVTELSDEFLALLLDVAKFQRALDNLIRNAIDAMPNGGTLTIRSKKVNNAIQLEVEDTGVGIKPEDMEKIFQPFYTTKPTGTGLGLVSSKATVEALGGTINVDSTFGAGTKVTLILPQKTG
jgi:signal transduction histidine kinase